MDVNEEDLYDATPRQQSPAPPGLNQPQQPALAVIAPNVPTHSPALQPQESAAPGINNLPPAALLPLKQPLTIRNLLPVQHLPAIPRNPESFSHQFLQKHLKGSAVAPGMHHGYNPASLAKTWFAINRKFEPYLPSNPGQHGAKLTNFMYELDDEPTEDIPLFIGELHDGQVRYTYFGQYRAPRWSDRLDYDRMIEEVPREAKRWHGAELCKKNRPAWLQEAMKKHFWPLPNISEIPLAQQGQVIEEHQREADEWMDNVTEDVILKCFDEPDFGPDNFTLRLAWEYFECIGYDVELYKKLVQRKLVEETAALMGQHAEQGGDIEMT